MNSNYQRRHSRWYEIILFNAWFQLAVGFLFIVIMPSIIRWPQLLENFWPLNSVQFSTIAANSAAFLGSFIVLKKMHRFPGSRTLAFIVPTLIFYWLVVVAVLLFFRLDYARSVLGTSFFVANIWAFLGFFIGRKYYTPKLALIPYGQAPDLADNPSVMATILNTPHLGERRYDAVVADLHSDMPDEWLQFISNCSLSHIPVYNTEQLLESLTGRTRITHLSENNFGHLQPSYIYMKIKRLIDILGVLLLFPFILPVLLITALLIKLDSKGPIFYNQKRMGFQGRPFTMYKFRSMRTDLEGKGFTEGEDDPRITRVGRFIRKYRIDELPQFLNVLKGEMSFIGPRPESLELSEWYQKDVPFFNYRHIVRPGISGWAQVTQGYAAEVEGMQEKLQYDFYYIKHFSPWLDILIVFKTIRTILTGFGSR